MRSHTKFKLFACICSMFILNDAWGQTEFPLAPILNYSNGFTNSADDLLEIGISHPLEKDSNDIGYLKFGGRLPVSKNEENHANIDKATDNFNAFLGGEWLVINNPITANNRTVFWGLEPSVEFGMQKFEFNRDSTDQNPEEIWKNNWAVELKSRFYTTKRASGAWQWGVFGRVRYSSSTSAADPVNILDPATNTVNELVVSEPNTKTTFTPAIGVNAYPGTDLPFSLATVFYYYFQDEDTASGFERERFRSEQWLYFYPLSDDDIGLRIGFGLFQDVYTLGKQDNDDVFGAMINVKMDANIIKSIF